MSSNSAAIEEFRRQLKKELDDLAEIDKRVLNQSVNKGLAYAKQNTPVVTGFLRKSWASNPIQEISDGVQKELVNTADYSLYWDAGHRKVEMAKIDGHWVAVKDEDGKTKTIGWIEGAHLLDKVTDIVEKSEISEFEKEIRRLQTEHG